MAQDREKVIGRIRKLMELAANNPSVEEATAAALKAQRMMAEHGVEGREVMRTAEEAVAEVRSRRFRGSPWAVFLGLAVADNFRCRAYVIDDGCLDREGRRHKTGDTVVFMGHRTDAEAATVTFDRLYEIGGRLAGAEVRKARSRYGTAAGVKNSFLMGFVRGIRKELEAQCEALALVTPEDVSDYADRRTDGFATSDVSVRGAYKSNSYDRGVRAGRDAMRAGRIGGARP